MGAKHPTCSMQRSRRANRSSTKTLGPSLAAVGGRADAWNFVAAWKGLITSRKCRDVENALGDVEF